MNARSYIKNIRISRKEEKALDIYLKELCELGLCLGALQRDEEINMCLFICVVKTCLKALGSFLNEQCASVNSSQGVLM